MRRALANVIGIAALAALGCSAPADPSEPKGAAAAPAYPAGPFAIAEGATLPDLHFEGVRDDGARGAIALGDYLAPASEGASSFLVVRVQGGLWCGTCRWSAQHTTELTSQGVKVLDLVVGDRDAAPATSEEALAWRAELDHAEGVAVGVDPSFTFGAISSAHDLVLPLVLMIDRRTMKLVDWIGDPAPDELAQRIAARTGAAPPPDEPLVDSLFTRNEWDLLRTVTEPGAPPPDPTNAVADDPAARALGKALFFDAGLSPSAIACASCHDPKKHLGDDRPVGKGAGLGDRRTPSVALAAHARWQFWDGRADTLWAQAAGPLESPREMASSRLFVARRVADRWSDLYAAAFPGAPAPSLQWPKAGKPGDAAFDALPAGEREAATRVLANVGKAMAAYERSFRVKPNALDAYLAGDKAVFTAEQKLGLQLFVREGCMQCHWGPRLTDDAFHDTGAPTGRADHGPDFGRASGVDAWLTSELRADGRFSDAPASRPIPSASARAALVGKMKTPALRGVGDQRFFGHGGAQTDVAAVTEAYGRGGDPTSAGVREPWLLGFGESVQWGLVPFLRTLHADVVVP